MNGADDVGLRNLALRVAYDGGGFHGFAESDGVRTVMGDLTAAIERVVRRPVELTGAGRTDRGVHGWGQVVTGLVPADTDLARLVRSVNGLCAPEIAVREPQWVDPAFSARFSARSRTYRYAVWNDPVPNPLVARHSWHVPAPLDVATMESAGRAFVGVHDFASFCRRPKPTEAVPAPSLVREVLSTGWTRPDDSPMLGFEISATSFCHQMVRSIVGTLVDVGLGRRPADAVPEMLAARDRNTAGRVAPPHGLVLWDVDYGDGVSSTSER